MNEMTTGTRNCPARHPPGKAKVRVDQVVALRPQLPANLSDATKVIPCGFPAIDEKNVKFNSQAGRSDSICAFTKLP